MSELLFPKLYVRNFRGIRELEATGLSRVNLITGDPGSGKSTVLDAIQVHSHCGDDEVLAEVLARYHEPMLVDHATHMESEYPDLANLFYDLADDWCDTRCDAISIGNGDDGRTLTIGPESLPYDDADMLMHRSPHRVVGDISSDVSVIVSRVNGLGRFVARRPSILSKDHRYIPCEYVSPRNVDRDRMFRMWSKIALTDGEYRLLESLQLVAPQVQRIGYTVSDKPRPIVGVEGYNRNLPLYRFGSGIAQVYQTALAIISTPGGVVLIDQPEFGLCSGHSCAYWYVVAGLAREFDVQVFAATSSSESVAGFQDVMSNGDCNLWHLANNDGCAVMTEYSGEFDI